MNVALSPAPRTVARNPACDAPGMLSGRLLVPAHDCWYPPAIEVLDLLQVDFDCRHVQSDGLYLVEELDSHGVVWRGCRRFARRPLSDALQMDSTGDGVWIDVPSLNAWRCRVVGLVEQVYKPAHVRAQSCGQG